MPQLLICEYHEDRFAARVEAVLAAGGRVAAMNTVTLHAQCHYRGEQLVDCVFRTLFWALLEIPDGSAADPVPPNGNPYSGPAEPPPVPQAPER